MIRMRWFILVDSSFGMKYVLLFSVDALKSERRKKYSLITLIGRGAGICQGVGRRYRVGSWADSIDSLCHRLNF